MNQLTKTAKNLDILFKILRVAISIGIVTTLVGLAIIAVGFLFDLDPYTIGTGYNSLTIGPLDLELSEAWAPDEHLVLLVIAAELVLTLVCLLVLRPCIDCIRDILHPMVNGEPFHAGISVNLKKLAKRSIILCILSNCAEILNLAVYSFGFDLPGLLLGDKITYVEIGAEFDLTFLIVAAVLYLLSYIFRYGEELQQLSDETL